MSKTTTIIFAAKTGDSVQKSFFLTVFLALVFTSGIAIGEDKPAEKTGVKPLTALAIAFLFDYTELELLTAGFVVRAPEGICAIEKQYEKNGVELRFLGMAHIGGDDFYQDLKKNLAGRPALMLMEGVTDDNDLLKTPPEYGSAANYLGLASQREKFSPAEMPETVEVIRADLDTSDFSADTIEALNFIGQIYSKEGINFSNLLLMYMRMSNPEKARSLMQDLITKRNRCLIEHLRQNLAKNSLIIVPWGAMHLPQIEEWATSEGFVLKEKVSRPVIRFPGYFRYVLPPTAPDHGSYKARRSFSELLGI